MTTAAPRRDVPATLEEVVERTHEAWTDYREQLRGLEGRDYDEAEHRAWERLQRQLRRLEERRAELEGSLAMPRA
jgi:chromosome segregation ATPase